MAKKKEPAITKEQAYEAATTRFRHLETVEDTAKALAVLLAALVSAEQAEMDVARSRLPLRTMLHLAIKLSDGVAKASKQAHCARMDAYPGGPGEWISRDEPGAIGYTGKVDTLTVAQTLLERTRVRFAKDSLTGEVA